MKSLPWAAALPGVEMSSLPKRKLYVSRILAAYDRRPASPSDCALAGAVESALAKTATARSLCPVLTCIRHPLPTDIGQYTRMASFGAPGKEARLLLA